MLTKQKTVAYPLATQTFAVPDGEEIGRVDLSDEIKECRGAPLYVEVDDQKHPHILTAEKLDSITLDFPAHNLVTITAKAEVVLKAAGRINGLVRDTAVQEAFKWLAAQGYDLSKPRKKDGPELVVPPGIWSTFVLARFERAAVFGAMVHRVGLPNEWLTIEGYANDMPELLSVQLAMAAYELNPHWDAEYRGMDELARMESGLKKER